MTHLSVYATTTLAPDKVLFSTEKCRYFILFLYEYVYDSHEKCLAKVLLMSIPYICFRGELRKLSCGYFLISGATNDVSVIWMIQKGLNHMLDIHVISFFFFFFFFLVLLNLV